MSSFKIGERLIGADAPPFIIAEMSGNHNQSLELALQIVEAAAKAGAHALKLQTYTAQTMTLDLAEGEFFIKDPNSLWAGTSLYDLYEGPHPVGVARADFRSGQRTGHARVLDAVR
jgi:N-acetylneuraminate synthase